jgi:hypothetical protein
MDFDGDKDKAEGKDALVPIRTRHIVNLAGGYPPSLQEGSWHWKSPNNED